MRRVRRPGSIGARAWAARFVAVLAVAVTAPAWTPPATAARAAPRLEVRAVDTLLVGRPERVRELERWAKDADLADLMWLLRRPVERLGASEVALVSAALARCPAERSALHARLVARLLDADPRARRSGRYASTPLSASPARPRASVFRVGALLPDSGDYADYARAVGIGMEAGLRSVPSLGDHAIEFDFWGTGDEHPRRLAEALEAASWREGVLAGELLSVPTLSLATGARLAGLPVISPTGTDETIGTIGPGIFQIGPSGWRRGERLARILVDRPGLKVGALTAGDPGRSALAAGFLAAAESLGAVSAWASGYDPGASFRDEAKALQSRKLDILLWEGEPRDAEAFLRELARQKVALRLCGGEGLLPERLHAESRVFLEGVHIVAEDWRLPEDQRAELDSVLVSRGADTATVLHVRGWLAGRAIAQAVASGALCPEELAAALAARTGSAPWLRERGFFDFEREGATIPVQSVQRGRAVPLP